MIKLYKIEELKEVDYKAYFNVVNKLMRDIGGASHEAIEKYCNQAGIYADTSGIIYKKY